MIHPAAVALVLAILALPAQAQAPAPDAGDLGAVRILGADNARPAGMVFLFSGSAGWGASETAVAEKLVADGAVVVGVDHREIAARAAAGTDECLYLVGDVEAVSQHVQRAAGVETYRTPIVAGLGEGGGLALDLALQSPAATIGHVDAVDPAPAPVFAKPLCGVAESPAETGVADIAVRFTAASTAARTLVADLAKRDIALVAEDAGETDPAAALAALVAEDFGTADPSDRLSALPVVELEAAGAGEAFAIIYSGDGGWRDLDKTIAENFQRRGVPVAGVDSLRYFWSQKPPQTVADDLAFLIRTYSARWKRQKVMLIGYSFGADVLPASFNLLPQAEKKAVRQLSLLGLAEEASFEISLSGWMGAKQDDARPVMPQLARIDPALIQCFRGREEEGSACAALDGTRYELVTTEGGHHFDGDYDALAERILAGFARREGRQP